MKCDSFIRMGEYSHFISKSESPWQSVSLHLGSSSRTYRIVYLAAGGGLMLCVVEISLTTFRPKITSLVTISSSEQVTHCLDYSESGKCSRCR